MDASEGSAENPYSRLIESVENDLASIQALYEAQRNNLEARSKSLYLSDAFQGVRPDGILVNLLNDPCYRDPRNNLCVWARPNAAVVDLISRCQTMLQKASPHIWLSPLDGLHMTVLVLAAGLSPEALAPVVLGLKPTLHEFAKFHLQHQTRLVKPKVLYDDAGVILSFVPTSGEIATDQPLDESYTFLHLQRDLFEQCRERGVESSAQKSLGSCYITIARFISNGDFCTGQDINRTAVDAWVAAVEEINETLRNEFWPCDGAAPEAGKWVIGKEQGLDIREGTSWYGGGQSLEF